MFSAVMVCCSVVLGQTPDQDLKRWESEITKLEAKLKAGPIPKEAVLFAGSSSIRLWDTAKAFPDFPTVNVGFGGSEIRHSTAFADRIIFPVQPKVIVLYAGDNDIANKRSPRQVRADFEKFVAVIQAKLPKTKIYFIAIKPSIKRWKQYADQTQANALIKEFCQNNPLLGYLDVVPGMLGADGKPVAEQFKQDELHLNDKGYANWRQLIDAELKAYLKMNPK